MIVTLIYTLPMTEEAIDNSGNQAGKSNELSDNFLWSKTKYFSQKLYQP